MALLRQAGESGKELLQGAHATVISGSAAAGAASPILTRAYNGTSHYSVAAINLGDVATLTISFWMYWDTVGTNDDLSLEYTIIGDVTASGGNGFYIDPNDAGGFVRGGGGGTGSRSKRIVKPSAGAWHQYVMLMDRTLTAGVPTVYVDGQILIT